MKKLSDSELLKFAMIIDAREQTMTNFLAPPVNEVKPRGERGIPQWQRHEQLIALAIRSQRFGSMTDVLPPEVLARPRDFGQLSEKLAKLAKPELPTPEQDRLMRTTYGLPLSRF